MAIKSAEFGFRLEVVLNLAQRERKENDRRAQQTGCCRGFNFKLKFNHWQALVTSQPHACHVSLPFWEDSDSFVPVTVCLLVERTGSMSHYRALADTFLHRRYIHPPDLTICRPRYQT